MAVEAARAALAAIPAFAGYKGPLERLGGLTNLVYRAGEACLRIPGKGTEEYINRANEGVAAREAAKAGVSPDVLHFDGATPRPAADIVVEACQPLAAHELRAAHDNAVSDHCPGGNGDDSWHIAEPSRTDAHRSYPAGHRHTGRCEETTAADAGEAAPATRRPAP